MHSLFLRASMACSIALVAGACASSSADEGDDADVSEGAFSGTLANPVLPVDCPDPGVLRDEDARGAIYTMVCTTNGPDDVFRFYRSRDLAHWETTSRFVFPGKHPESDLARRHPWASDNFWAPEIHRMPDDVDAKSRYVVYYTARDRENHRLCIGTAMAPTAMGPYVESKTPIVCHDGFGVIDAHAFRDDDGKAYLYWKDDGNDRAADIQSALGGHTKFQVQRLTHDGLSLADARGARSALAPVALIDHDLPWEGDLVEAPWVVKRNGTYFLFYSAFSYCDSRYAVGVASSRSPLGPFVKQPGGNPILTSGNGFDGPGHGSVVRGPTGDTSFFVYHAWNAGENCTQPSAARRILVDPVTWPAGNQGWPKINDGHPSR